MNESEYFCARGARVLTNPEFVQSQLVYNGNIFTRWNISWPILSLSKFKKSYQIFIFQKLKKCPLLKTWTKPKTIKQKANKKSKQKKDKIHVPTTRPAMLLLYVEAGEVRHRHWTPCMNKIGIKKKQDYHFRVDCFVWEGPLGTRQQHRHRQAEMAQS